MTREQIQQRIADLEGQQQLLVLTKLSAGNKECQDVLEASRANVTKKDQNMQETLNTSVTELASSHCSCISAGYKKPGVSKEEIPECQNYKTKLADALKNADDRGMTAAEVKELDSLLGDDNTKSIDAALARINVELTELNADLATAPVKEPDVVDATGEPFDPTDRWFGFAYDYEQTNTSQTTGSFASTYSSASSSYQQSNSYSWWGRRRSSYSDSYSSSYSSSLSQSFSEMTNSKKISVKGKLLRVTCQRPWFRPSLFRNNRYKIVSFHHIRRYILHIIVQRKFWSYRKLHSKAITFENTTQIDTDLSRYILQCILHCSKCYFRIVYVILCFYLTKGRRPL